MVRITSAVVAVALSAACSDRAERKTEATASDATNAASRAGGAVAGAARDAGNAAKDAARATGDAVMNGGRAADAAVETMDVKMALTTDSRVDASNINVDTDHLSKTVTLKGHVPTAAQKTIAEEIAKAKATGYAVKNDLTVAR
ncbi:MAG: BON domain-containing protein [Acidobacteriota bacterium]